jgi:signal transduction histidine kinase
MLRQSRALARNAIRELRTETVPSRLEGVVNGLKRIADSWNQSGVLTISVNILGQVRPLPVPLECHLLGIGTEAITNAVKHGQASAIQVEIVFRSDEVALRIKDNGIGFNPAQQLERASGCFGLLGMRERAREMSGELRLQSQPGQGTEVVATAPAPSEPEFSVLPVHPVTPTTALPIQSRVV